jgi:hypothetical protein
MSDEQKQRIEDKCDVWHALIALDRSVTPRMLDILARTRRLIETGTADRLAEAEFIVEANIQSAENHAGWKGDEQFLLEMGRLYRQKKFGVIRFPKWFIDSKLFSNYAAVFPPWKKIQPHCLVNVDFSGRDLDMYLPEASLYEDMCLAYNQAFNLKNPDTKPDVKARAFYVRSTVISAFNFVESFLNGLAFDFVTTCRRTLSEAEVDFLTEWDSKRKRQRYVKLREKAVQYPKIVLNRKNPPFTESTCAPLQILMLKVRLRDAVVHSSPKPIGDEIPKMKDLVEMELDDATKVADAAVDFVKLVDQEVHKGRYDNTWLIPRSDDGQFPPESFS